MNTRFAIAAASLVATVPLALCACPSYPPPEPAVVMFPPYDADADGVARLERCDEDGGGFSVPADCRAACESMAKIGCPESANAGRSCGCTCAKAEIEHVPMKTYCIATASTPDQMRACNVRCMR